MRADNGIDSEVCAVLLKGKFTDNIGDNVVVKVVVTAVKITILSVNSGYLRERERG